MTPASVTARPLAAAGLLMVCAQAASAGIYEWNYPPASGVPAPLSDKGGTIDSIRTTFDPDTKRLSWDVRFSDRVTQGFYLVLTDGANPTGSASQFSVFYFDAYDVFDSDPSQDIKLTSYTFNGTPSHASWRDGDSHTPGDQQPDCIKSALDTSWITNISAANIALPGGAAGRGMSFTVNIGEVLAHIPMYAIPGQIWKGTGFGDSLGLRFVPAEVFEVDYTPDGEIDWLGVESEGGFEATFAGLLIPAPAGSLLALSGLGLLFAPRRSRRAHSAPQSPGHTPGASHSRH